MRCGYFSVPLSGDHRVICPLCTTIRCTAPRPTLCANPCCPPSTHIAAFCDDNGRLMPSLFRQRSLLPRPAVDPSRSSSCRCCFPSLAFGSRPRPPLPPHCFLSSCTKSGARFVRRALRRAPARLKVRTHDIQTYYILRAVETEACFKLRGVKPKGAAGRPGWWCSS